MKIVNNEKAIASYVVKEITGSSAIERKAIELYKLNFDKEPKTIIDVMQMVTNMYSDFIWDYGFDENEVAEIDIELKQFIEENVTDINDTINGMLWL